VEVEESFEYVSRYALLTNDALNAATMKVNKITSIVTSDKDFERLAGVRSGASSR
jgi:predicted nucleic acid-binding protein